MEIIKSPYDDRKYKGLILPNKLKVMLVSDKFTMAGCCLRVGVGTMCDGDVEGLAHFVEHMLFMGSKKYPSENELMKFIFGHGGSTNAYTSQDATTYHFVIDNNFLEEGMDIFGQLFIEPLFNADAIEREMNAVDSEHMKNLNQDGWRMENLRKTLASKTNPYSKFSSGSKDTLDIPDIREKVINFFNKYYSSNIMYLCVLGNQSIDVLEKMVTKVFGLIKNNDVKIPKYDKFFDITPQICKFVQLERIEKISITWEFKKPIDEGYFYTKYLITSHDRNSLGDILYSKNLVSNINFYFDNIDDETYICELNVELIGSPDKNEILEHIADYLHFIKKGINKKYYDYIKTSKEISFFYGERDPMEELIDIITYAMHEYGKTIPMEKILLFNLLTNDYSEEVEKRIYDFIDSLKFKNAVIMMCSKLYKSECNLVDKRYNVQYKLEFELPKLNKFDSIKTFEFPSDNKYISRNIKINENIKEFKRPKIINDKIMVMYNPKAKSPFVYVSCLIFNSFTKSSTKNEIESIVKFNYLNDILIPLVDKIDMMYGNFSVRYSGDIIILSFNCFEENIYGLIDDVLSEFTKSIDKKMFENAKKSVYDYFKSLKYYAPYSKLGIFVSSRLEKGENIRDFTEEVKKVDFERVNNFWDNVEDTDVKCYIQGNVEESKIKDIYSKFYPFVKKLYKPTKKDLQIIRDIGESKIIGINDNKHENNSIVSYICQLGYDEIIDEDKWYHNHCCLNILDDILEELFFNELRTKDQLGYYVKCYKFPLGYIQNPFKTYMFCVQTNLNLEMVLEKIKEFIKYAYDYLKRLSVEEYNINIKSKIDFLKGNFLNGFEEMGYYTNIIKRQHEILDIDNKIANYYKKITKKDVVDFYNKNFLNGTYWTVFLEAQ